MKQFQKYTSLDFSLYFDLVREDEVMKFIWGRGMTKDEAIKKFEFIINLNNQDESLGYFKIAENGIHIGDCKLVNYRKDEAVFEIGYLLKKEYWGKGFGTIICKEMLNLAEKLNPNKDIVGIINPENIASKKLLKKFGFESYFQGIEDDVNTEKLILKK